MVGERCGLVFEAPEFQHKAPVPRIALALAFAAGPALEITYGRVAVDAGDFVRVRCGPIVAIQTTTAETDERRLGAQSVACGEFRIALVPKLHRIGAAEHVVDLHVNDVEAFAEQRDVRRGLVAEELAMPNPRTTCGGCFRRDDSHELARDGEFVFRVAVPFAGLVREDDSRRFRELAGLSIEFSGLRLSFFHRQAGSIAGTLVADIAQPRGTQDRVLLFDHSEDRRAIRMIGRAIGFHFETPGIEHRMRHEHMALWAGMHAVFGKSKLRIALPLFRDGGIHRSVDVEHLPALLAHVEQPVAVEIEHLIVALVGLFILVEARRQQACHDRHRVKHRRR